MVYKTSDFSPNNPLLAMPSESSRAFSFSPDGKSLAVIRSREGGDIFLLREAAQTII